MTVSTINNEEKTDKETLEDSTDIEKIVDQIIGDAYHFNVSDIHIEPSSLPETTRIRFRIDGICQEYKEFSDVLANNIVKRIKTMANLDIDQTRLPQDGYIKFQDKQIPGLELRVTTYPTDGLMEDAVLRFLDKQEIRDLDKMDFSDHNLTIIKRALMQPYGLLLVTGPTGSGKTTTLHSILSYINKPGLKILAAEDSIEIKQWGIRQVEVKPEFEFNYAKAMRSFLRADPDVIMIGKISDEETASLCITAAQTGHLIISSLELTNTAESITRLLDMGINSLNLSDAMLGEINQRLVRKLCYDCREEYRPSKEEYDQILLEYGKNEFNKMKIENGPESALYYPVGCDKCRGTGFSGRLGIHEILKITPEIKSLIKKKASAEVIFEQAIKDGMQTLKQDGILKVLQSMTLFSEVRQMSID